LQGKIEQVIVLGKEQIFKECNETHNDTINYNKITEFEAGGTHN
jgi:hypothetical protein